MWCAKQNDEKQEQNIRFDTFNFVSIKMKGFMLF